MSDVSIMPELQYLIKRIENLYKPSVLSNLSIEEIDINKFFISAQKNNILFHVLRTIFENNEHLNNYRELITNMIERGKSSYQNLSKTISSLTNMPVPYLIIKTDRGHPRISSDIDVLVKDLDTARSYLEKKEYKSKYYDKKDQSTVMMKEGYIPIHLQRRVTWCWKLFMDEEFIFNSPKSHHYAGQEIVKPNANADFLIHLAHINYEPLFITLSELFYLFSIHDEIEFSLLFEQTKKYNWQKTFYRTVNLFNNFHKIMFGEILFEEIEFKELSLTKLNFPHFLSRLDIIKGSLEKRLFLYPISKLGKVIKVLRSGDPMTNYYTHSEAILTDKK